MLNLCLMRIHLFNPENDVSLAYGRCHVTMSPLVRRLHDDGALLPLWYAGAGDLVYAPLADREWVDRMLSLFALDVTPVDSCRGAVGAPWGWSYDACRTLRSAGASVIDDDRVERLRMLSHRRISAEIMSRLSGLLDMELPPVPEEIASVAGVLECMHEWGAVYVKAPWSSSGRGVFLVDSMTPSVERRISGILRRQGSVMVEKALNKKRDFAMLFYSEKGRVTMCGYSVFFNSSGDTYGGNIMADRSELEDMIVAAGASRSGLHAVAAALERILGALVADCYEGYFGVDMLVTDSGMIAPCVELNLRMTMGVVAMIWRERYLHEASTGIFRVSAAEHIGEAPVVEAGRLKSGVLSLTPSAPGGFFFTVEARPSLSELQ